MSKTFCVNCHIDESSPGSKLCCKCIIDIDIGISERGEIANPTATKLDEINDEMNRHNTVYKNIGEC